MTKKVLAAIVVDKDGKFPGPLTAFGNSGHLQTRDTAKSGRFSEGVRHVTTRDRAGLIKLADR